MLTLTTPLPVPNLQKIKVAAVQLDGDNNVASITCVVFGPGAKVYATVGLSVRDGDCQGLRGTVTPLGYSDIIELFTVTRATGFTDLVAAYTGNIGNRNKAAETFLMNAGLLPAGTVA